MSIVVSFADGGLVANVVLFQVGARECVLEENGPHQRELEQVMARCDVLCTPKHLKSFKGGKDEAVKVQALPSRVFCMVSKCS